MLIMVYKSYVFLLLLTLRINFNQTRSFQITVSPQELILKIEKALNFYEKYYLQINLDGFVGFELLRESISLINANYKIDKYNISKHIKGIYARLSSVNEKAWNVISKRDYIYATKIKKVISNLMKYKSKWKKLSKDNLFLFRLSSNNEYDEEQGDDCLKELTEEKCAISFNCSKVFLDDRRAKGYVATHIAIYLLIYKQIKCNTLKNTSLPGSLLDTRIDQVCHGILQENQELLRCKPNNISENMDLLLEQIVICGGKFGFVDFFSLETFNVITKIQDQRDGCIREESYLHNLNNIADRSHNSFLRLQKRRDSYINEDCSSHLFGIGVASYGKFLEYFLTNNNSK